MNVSVAVACKVINLFFILLLGIVLRRTRVLDKHTTSALSSLLVNVANPFLVICAFQKPYTSELVRRGFTVLGLSVAMHVLAALIGLCAFRMEKERHRRKIFSFAATFANCGFLGYPVLIALCSSLGDENGLFYGVFFTLFFNIFCWTYGVVVMNDGKGLPAKELCKKIFLNPSFLSTFLGLGLYLGRVTVPAFLSEGMNYVGNMTFPLSMIITGSLFCELKWREVFSDKLVYWYMALKLIAFPLCMIGAMRLLHVPTLYAYILVTMSAMPAASNTAIMADYYGADRRLAAKCVSLSTMASVVTIPLMIYLASRVLG